jgi:hypothetical protein
MLINGVINALPAGPGPASDEMRSLYRNLEPWYWLMRVLAVGAALLAVWRPT